MNLYNLVGLLIIHVLLTGIKGQLLVEDASEGPCLSVSELLPHLYSGLNLVPVLKTFSTNNTRTYRCSILTPGDYYVPMASQALYRQYAEGLLGRPAANEEELNAMQLVFRCGPLFSTIQNMGFPYMKNPPRFSQTCVSAGLPSFPNLGFLSGSVNVDYVQAVCLGMPAVRPDGAIAMSASPSFISTMDSIVWVNPEETVLLTYRCPANGIKDYKVVSKTKTLSPWDIEQIKKKIAVLGFREDHITFMRYDDELKSIETNEV